jgi:hypothetical protein
MERTGAGDLVRVATGGPEIDGIIFDVPSSTKAVVAVMDRRRGPVLRTVQRTALTDRTEAGADDRALLLLIRRTPPTAHGGARGGAGGGLGHSGHARAVAHRTTGR